MTKAKDSKAKAKAKANGHALPDIDTGAQDAKRQKTSLATSLGSEISSDSDSEDAEVVRRHDADELRRIEEEYAAVFEHNKVWAAQKVQVDPGYFARQALGQSPEFLWIGCADSRVPANEIMGTEPGHVFVHRNVANLVVNTDLNCHAVIQYAVDVLKVKHVVVCGHYGCGGVKAACQHADLGSLNGWLREIRDVHRLHFDELDAIKDETAKHRRLVELNVQEQCINVIKTAFVQKNWIARGYPIVHGWVYDFENGRLKDLDLPFQKILHKIQKVRFVLCFLLFSSLASWQTNQGIVFCRLLSIPSLPHSLSLVLPNENHRSTTSQKPR